MWKWEKDKGGENKPHSCGSAHTHTHTQIVSIGVSLSRSHSILPWWLLVCVNVNLNVKECIRLTTRCATNQFLIPKLERVSPSLSLSFSLSFSLYPSRQSTTESHWITIARLSQPGTGKHLAQYTSVDVWHCLWSSKNWYSRATSSRADWYIYPITFAQFYPQSEKDKA